MKTLVLIRHAKSSWAGEGIQDSERSLTERGKKDAPEMAKRLIKRGLKIDLLLSSSAKRAKKTARYFAEEMDYPAGDIQIEKKLYGAFPSDFETVVAALNNKHGAVALFSHNPGLTDYANTLTPVQTDNIPTTGIFAVQANIETWHQFTEAEKSFLFYDYPKNT